MASLLSGHQPHRDRVPPIAMAQRRFFSSPLDQQRDQLDGCWELDCDIDPLILRARVMHRRGEVNWAVGLEQEVLPIV
ncbi:MAG: hypothetical protein H2063_03580 [Synechococcus sp.]|uniref:hypothetical protein n=1 Tax=Synechococcus sp. MU1617 TaxID=2508346 RepID=UPI00181ADF91|nr:hypothetical protein [Synechococcus sp. MU1617]MBA4736268.1 hypothetical protein [Synechococcus sp.]MCB4388994.1 hypothetical protein [Synechococcus sp. MU1617]